MLYVKLPFPNGSEFKCEKECDQRTGEVVFRLTSLRYDSSGILKYYPATKPQFSFGSPLPQEFEIILKKTFHRLLKNNPIRPRK